MIPVGADITPGDELLYILSEIMRIEAEWVGMRDSYTRKWDFDTEYIASLIPQGDYIGEDELLGFTRAVGVVPSSRELSLFLKRFDTRGKIEKSEFRRVILGREGIQSKVQLKDQSQQSSRESLAQWLKTLFHSLTVADKLKTKFLERQSNLDEAFKVFKRESVDENLLRDRLLERNVLASSQDLATLVSLISGQRAVFGLDELRRFFQGVPN